MTLIFGGKEIVRKLNTLGIRLFLLERKIMAKFDEVTAKLDEVEVTLVEVSEDLDEVIAKLESASGGLTAEETAAVLARVTGIASSLRTIGDKVPEPVVEV